MAAAAIAASGFQNTGLLVSLQSSPFDEGEFLEESQRNITSCLLDTLCHVPPFRKNGLPPAAQIHRLSNAVSTVVVLPFYISLLQMSWAGSKNSLQNISNPPKDEIALQKQSSRRLKRKERSEEIFVQNTSAEAETNVSVNRGEHEMNKQKRTSESSPSDSEECEEASLIATDGENSAGGAECWHCSGCILETDAARRSAQNASSGAKRSVQVQTTAKCLMPVCCCCNTEQMLCLFAVITVFGETCLYGTAQFACINTVTNSVVVVFCYTTLLAF